MKAYENVFDFYALSHKINITSYFTNLSLTIPVTLDGANIFIAGYAEYVTSFRNIKYYKIRHSLLIMNINDGY